MCIRDSLGTEYVRKGGTLGFLSGKAEASDREAHDKIDKALKAAFRPEFINRIDEIIMFSPLSLEEMESIVILQMKELQDRLNDHNIAVQITDAARSWLAKEGYDPAFGARPLRRAIQKYVESPLSMELLGGKFKDGAEVIVDVDEKENKIIFSSSAPAKKKKNSKQEVEV